MKSIKGLIGVVFLASSTSGVVAQTLEPAAKERGPAALTLAQATEADADYNKADREQIERERKQLKCRNDCDTIFKGQYAACGGYPGTGYATCLFNVDKNKAKCYKACK